MYQRLFITAFLVVACSSLLAQPEITSITYQGDEAILTTNIPPPGIIYYWQGTSCGTLMNHSASTTVANTDGTYYLRQYNSTGAVWSSSCASTVVLFPDVTPPILSNVTPGPIEEGDPIDATSNEDGMLFLVPAGTPANYSAIVDNRVASAIATANVSASLSTAGNGLGDFVVYAADEAHNVSTASAVITVTDLTAPVLSDVTVGPIDEGDPIAATSNESGIIYLVPDGTPADYSAINAAMVSSAGATTGIPVSLSTTGIGMGDFIVYAVDSYNNVSMASAVIAITDLTPPVLSDVTAGSIDLGSDILATSNEDGMIYLVPDGTAPDVGAIIAARVVEAAATAGVPVAFSTSGIALGDYIVYAMDGADNISAASPVITVTAASYIDLNKTNPNQVQLYPVTVVDFLYIKSNVPVTAVKVYSLIGTRVINMTTPTDQVDMSSLYSGVYIVSVFMENNVIYSSKVTKK